MQRITCIIILGIFVASPLAQAGGPSVYVDAMFGGDETGPTINGVHAKVLTLNVSKEIIQAIPQMGVSTLLLREDDRFLSIGEKIRYLHSANALAYLGVKIELAPRDCIHIIHPSDKSSFRPRDQSKHSSDDIFPIIAALAKKRSASFAKIVHDKLSKTSVCTSTETRSDHLLEVSSLARPTIIIELQTTGSRGSYLLNRIKMGEISAAVAMVIDTYINELRVDMGTEPN